MRSDRKIKPDGLFHGVLYSTLGAVKLSLLIGLIASLFTLLEEMDLEKALVSFLFISMIYTLITGMVAFCAALVVGVPVVAFLAYFQLADKYIAAFLAALIMSVLVLWGKSFHQSLLLFIAYSWYCGWSFMRGYEKS